MSHRARDAAADSAGGRRRPWPAPPRAWRVSRATAESRGWRVATAPRWARLPPRGRTSRDVRRQASGCRRARRRLVTTGFGGDRRCRCRKAAGLADHRGRRAAGAAPRARSRRPSAYRQYSVATQGRKVLPLCGIYDIQSGAVAFPRIASLKTAQAFRDRLAALGIALPFDETLQSAPASPLARPLESGGLRAGNRWCILPMEGWDGTLDGRPSELTTRRWRHFGLSGAKLIWGGEAVAVREDGRANPNQLVIRDETVGDLDGAAPDAVARTPRALRRAPTICWSACSSRTPVASRVRRRAAPRRASPIAIRCSMRASACATTAPCSPMTSSIAWSATSSSPRAVPRRPASRLSTSSTATATWATSC